MPRTFFDQVLVTEAPRRGSRWMKIASLVLHIGIVLAILILPITAAFQLPGVYTSLPPVMLATVPKMPPPPAAPREVSQISPAPAVLQTVPLEAPQGVIAEKEAPPPAPPSSLTVPGGTGTVQSLMGVGMDNATLSIPSRPTEQKPLRVGGDVKPPERTIYKAPQYPPAAQAARIEGTVTLEAIIDADGVVQNLKVLGSVPLLDRAAIEAVQQWRYSPTRLNGVAIPIIMTVRVTFTLR
ncbi:MAG TPA: energy transducer TonB [Vicinamibacterales bacterium]|nr:energy transducer TonB [Vicinamibacterales bacterium]